MKMTRASALFEYIENMDQNGPIIIGGISFFPSDILKKMDPIAFDVGFNDYVDYLESNGMEIE